MRNNISDPNTIHPCTGCAMCYAVCPTQAINIRLDEEGFYMPSINLEKCIYCGLCKDVCYRYDNEDVNNYTSPIICLSAINRNSNELENASSGAVSIELMRECLQAGYQVVGTAYNTEKEHAEVVITKDVEQLYMYRGSKYMQSFSAEAFRTIAQDQSDRRYAIFGTPCQIYAISKWAGLKNCRGRYLLVDIFCHGCPSLNLWKKYLDHTKRKFGVSRFDEIRFRSKTHGWHEYCHDFIYKSRHYSSSKYNDPFNELFLNSDVMNEACYDCVPRSSMSSSDIRLGDFWGWQFDEDIKGVSAVVVNTSRGGELLDSVSDKFFRRVFGFNDVISSQSFGKNNPYNETLRKEVLSQLTSDCSLMRIVDVYRSKKPISYRIKQSVKRIMKHIPTKLYLKIKFNIHKLSHFS